MASVKKTIKPAKRKASIGGAARAGAGKSKTKTSKGGAERKTKKVAAAPARTPAGRRSANKTNLKEAVAANRTDVRTAASATRGKTAARSAAAAPSRSARSQTTKVRSTKTVAATAAKNSARLVKTAPPSKSAAAKKATKTLSPARADKVQSGAKSTQPTSVARKSSVSTRAAAERFSAARAAAAANTSKIGAAPRRASKSQLPVNPAAAPSAPALSLSPIPGENERTTVTKKIEKKTSVRSVATDALLAPPNAATAHAPQVHAAQVQAPHDQAKKAAVKPVKTTVAAVSASLGTPTDAVAPAGAVRTRAAEPKPDEAKQSDKPAAAASKAVKAVSPARQGFKPLEFIVYPAHGVGQIVAIEEQVVAGFKLELFVISFIKDKMILKVPTPKVASVGMRKLADADIVKRALDTLAGRARIKRTMWSRRAQEYEAKINSGDLISIAEVVRDLYRSDAQPEQSYSERQLYEAALDRMAREIVVVQKLTETESLKAIEAQLQKGPRRGKAEEVDADDADIEEAA